MRTWKETVTKWRKKLDSMSAVELYKWLKRFKMANFTLYVRIRWRATIYSISTMQKSVNIIDSTLLRVNPRWRDAKKDSESNAKQKKDNVLSVPKFTVFCTASANLSRCSTALRNFGTLSTCFLFLFTF